MAGPARGDSQLHLQSSTARYLGKAIPKTTTEFPDVIHEPLRAIYSPCTVKRHDLLIQKTIPVTIHVFSSGIEVEEKKPDGKVVNWYPIQNLYCSAGVRPDKEGKSKSLVFRKLREKTKSTAQPLFAMVVRQPSSEGRRVLMCHAYLVDNDTEVQKLVNATKQAYQNRAGWNYPENDKAFLDAKLSYTLQQLEKNGEPSLEELKTITDRRDKQLGQQPSVKAPSAQRVTRHGGTKSVVVRPAPQSRSMIVRRAPQAQSMIVRSAPPTPRLMIARAPNPVVAVDTGMMLVPSDLRVPTTRARSFYQGFNTETLNGEYGPIKAASDVGFSQSARTDSHNLSPNMNKFSHKFNSTHRRNGSSATPRGHRILASSEPQELPNGFNNHSPTPVSYAETNGNVTPVMAGKKSGHSKHHRPSKKTMEKFLHQNGDENGQSLKQRRPSQNSAGSDSSYSITKLDNQPTTSGVNGFLRSHEHADQEL